MPIENSNKYIAYTKIPNHILDNIHLFTPHSFAVYCYILRRTVGWQRKSAVISYSDFRANIKISQSALKDALSQLMEGSRKPTNGKAQGNITGLGLIKIKNILNGHEYSLTDTVFSVPGSAPADQGKPLPTKALAQPKENIFDQFFSMYPIQVARVEASKAWDTLTQKERRSALEGAKRYRAHIGRRMKEPGFNPDKVPYASTWLMSKRWADKYGTDDGMPKPKPKPPEPVDPKEKRKTKIRAEIAECMARQVFLESMGLLDGPEYRMNQKKIEELEEELDTLA